MFSNIQTKGIAALAVVLMLCVPLVPALAVGSDAETHGTYTATASTVNIQPGQTWSWTPSFPEGLSPTMTVKASDSAMPSGTDGYSASATVGGSTVGVSNGTITVQLSSNYDKQNFYVSVKAMTTHPTQYAYYDITFVVGSYELSYSPSAVVAKVGTAISDLEPTLSGWSGSATYTISPALPAGLSIDPATGVISGTPTAATPQTTYTVSAVLNTVPPQPQPVTATVSIGTFTDISAASYTIYAITGETAIAAPGVTMPAGTALDHMDLSATKDGSAVSVTAGAAYNGMTIASGDGALSGTPSVAGTYVFTETFTATAATGGSSATRTVTVVVEDKVAISGSGPLYSYDGHSDSLTLTKGAGPAGVVWSIETVQMEGVQGTPVPVAAAAYGISLVDGVLTSSSSTPAGTYMVDVKLATANATATTSGATGASPAENYQTIHVMLYVSPMIAFTNATGGVLDEPFYMATNKVYDSLTVGSNLDEATFAITGYGADITSLNISMAADGTVAPGAVAVSEAGDYTVVVTVTDSHNPTNTATATLNVSVANALVFSNDTTASFIVE